MDSLKTPRTRRARVLSLLVVFCVLVLGVWLPGSTQQARAAAGGVSVRIDPAASNLTADATGAGVVGTIRNTSGSAIGDATVTIGVAGTVLDTSSAISAWEEGRSRITTSTVGTTRTGALADGAEHQFKVAIAATKLPWKYQLAALPMTVTVTDTSSGATLWQRRTTLQMQNGATTSPLKVGWVVPLTLPADPALFGPSGTARDEAWNKAIGSGSRVQQLITSLAGEPVTWLVDPMLLDPPVGADDNVPVSRITDPTTQTGAAPSPSSSTSTSSSTPTSPSSSPTSTASPNPSSTASSTGSSTATSTTSASAASTSNGTDGTSDVIPSDAVGQLVSGLLTELRSLGSGQRVWWTAYDDPDVNALLDHGSALLRRDVSRPLPPALSAISTMRATWPVGDTGAGQVARITSAWTGTGQKAPVVILPRRSAPANTATNSVGRVSGTGGVVLYDESLSRVTAGGDDPGLASSRILAETIAIYQQAPGSDRSVTVAVPRETTQSATDLAATIKAVDAAGWTGSLDHTADLARAPAATLLATPTKGTPYPAVPATPVTAAILATLDRQRQRVDTLGSVLVDSDDVVSARKRALDVIGSSRWRGHADRLQTVVRANRHALTQLSDKVNVNPSTVNFFADSGRLAVTVVNDLNRPVHDVSLLLQPRRYLLRIDAQPKPIDLRANSRASVRTEVTAVSQGEVAVDARLFAPGDVPLSGPGVSTQLMVNVRPTSTWIYWVLGIVGGLVLAIGLMRSLRRGPRRATVDPTHAGPTPSDAIVAVGPARTTPAETEQHADESTDESTTDSPTTKVSPTDDQQS